MGDSPKAASSQGARKAASASRDLPARDALSVRDGALEDVPAEPAPGPVGPRRRPLRARTPGYDTEYSRRPEVKARTRALFVRRNYGVTLVQYLAQHAHQAGKCSICRTNGKLHADHCHVTGKFRGLLCHQCNAALGFLRDNPAIIGVAQRYVRGAGEH